MGLVMDDTLGNKIDDAVENTEAAAALAVTAATFAQEAAADTVASIGIDAKLDMIIEGLGTLNARLAVTQATVDAAVEEIVSELNDEDVLDTNEDEDIFIVIDDDDDDDDDDNSPIDTDEEDTRDSFDGSEDSEDESGGTVVEQPNLEPIQQNRRKGGLRKNRRRRR